MATLKIVSEEHWAILKEYFVSEDSGVVLIPEEVLSQMPDDQVAKLRVLADTGNGSVDYDFGDDADLLVDIALHVDAYALRRLLGAEDPEMIDRDALARLCHVQDTLCSFCDSTECEKMSGHYTHQRRFQ